MSVIYCGKLNNKPYYIKEADINIYTIQELSYYIYNYAMLITNNFISKNLIMYIDNVLELHELAEKLNIQYNTKQSSLVDLLMLILEYSNYYNVNDIKKFKNRILKLVELDEYDYINLAGDTLFELKKYEKAIRQYEKIAKEDDNALLKLAYCYAKLQFYDNAIYNFKILFNRTRNLKVLKDMYFCYKLFGSADEMNEYKNYISSEVSTEWELEIVKLILDVKSSDSIKEKEELFLMGDAYIKDSLNTLIKVWKNKYRYIS